MAGFFGFFDYTKPGKGVEKEEFKPNISSFFRIFFGRFWKLLQLNTIYFICSIPMFAVMLLYLPVESLGSEDNIIPMYQLMVSFLLYFAVVGIAPITTGFTYVLRNFSSDRHSWIFSDFFEHIKKNYKQAFGVLALDILAVLVIPTAYSFYTQIIASGAEASDMMRNVAFFARTFIVIFGGLYFIMHFYIYQIMVTFDMKLKQILKNSLIFSLAHLPRNLGILLLITIIAGLTFGMSTFIGILLSFLISASLIGYIVNFIVHPVIAKHMIKPEDDSEDTTEENIIEQD